MSEYSDRHWIDAHCHLSDSRFGHDIERVLERSRANGIKAFLQGGVSPDEWNVQLDLKERFSDCILPVFGLHPWWVASSNAQSVAVSMAALEALAFDALAIGECGLDASKDRATLSTWDLQKSTFQEQLVLANDLQKPVVLHIVQAHEEALRILKETRPVQGGLVHSFSGSREVAAQYVDLGLCLSVSGVVCREGYESLKQAIPGIPDKALLIETDAPDQSPDGPTSRNEPERLVQIAQAVAQLRNQEWEAVLDNAAKNVERVLKKRVAR